MKLLKPLGQEDYTNPKEALEELSNYQPSKIVEDETDENSLEEEVGDIITVNLGNIKDPENYVFLEARQHGKHEYPDLYVYQHRLGVTPETKGLDKFKFEIKNTAKEKNGHEYVGDINHDNAMLLARGFGYPLSLRTGVDFLKELRDGAKGVRKVFDGNRDEIKPEFLRETYEEITKVRNPWRSEWFLDKYGEGEVTYGIPQTNGDLKLITEPLEDCLMQDKRPGIDLDYWLDNATFQGLPPEDTLDGGLYYWHPRNGAVARFSADSAWAYLNCGRYPGYSDSALGVRFCAEGASSEK